MTTRTGPASTPTRDAIADDLERIAIGAVGLTTRALAGAETDLELTFPQWRAILVVGNDADGARIGEVAARVGVTLPATSRLLRRLERRGLTALESDTVDRRATRVRLTERGHAIRSAILAHRRAALEEMAASLPESERRQIAAGLRRIAAGFDRFA
ncbi:MAG TPA: MarR family winged helix-turn-helix transcriptional regulator [Candidatus Limnocylindrales bacterium]|jgi:DNA-binding MarR family transcriptional regulator|nr:MarR family winged helix-turn-helix transcriptional regulator [Candidatus Limnocylindrales bacterium]